MSILSSKKTLVMGIAILLLSVGCLFLVEMTKQQKDVDLVGMESATSMPTKSTVLGETDAIAEGLAESIDPAGEIDADLPQQPVSSSVAPRQLAKFLPTWLVQEGNTIEDSREIFGRTVLRSRARHQWDDGGLIEVEMTDIGAGADDAVIQALGFDLSLEEGSTETSYTAVQDEGGILMNQEYDSMDQAGSLQLFIGDRYLVEIQVENFPEATFQEILDEHIAFDELFETLALQESE